MRGLLLSFYLLFCLPAVSLASPTFFESKLAELRKMAPEALSVSPKGYLLITRNRRTFDFRIEVLSLESGKVVGSDRSSRMQYVPTWSPDERFFVFLEATADNLRYKFFRFDLEEGERTELPVPQTEAHNVPILFSPDGSQVLTLLQQDASAKLVTFVASEVEGPPGFEVVEKDIRDPIAFSWLPSGRGVAYASQGKFSILQHETGGLESKVLCEDCGIDSFVFAESEKEVFISLKLKESEKYTLHSYNVETEELTEVLTRVGDIVNVRKLSGQYSFQHLHKGSKTLELFDRTAFARKFGPEAGEVEMQAISENGRFAYLLQRSQRQAPQVVRLNRKKDDIAPSVLYPQTSGGEVIDEPEAISIESGVAYLWGKTSVEKLLILVRESGSILWHPLIQLLLQEEYSVLEVVGTDEKHVAAVLTYAEEQLKVRPNDVTLLGLSPSEALAGWALKPKLASNVLLLDFEGLLPKISEDLPKDLEITLLGSAGNPLISLRREARRLGSQIESVSTKLLPGSEFRSYPSASMALLLDSIISDDKRKGLLPKLPSGKSALWIQSKYIRGVTSKTGEQLLPEDLELLAQTINQNDIRYGMFLAGPFQKDGKLPHFVFSETAESTVSKLKELCPNLKILPWVGGAAQKDVFLQDQQWVKRAVSDVKKMISFLDVDGVHTNIELLISRNKALAELQGSKDIKPEVFSEGLISFQSALRKALPDSYLSIGLPSSSPQTNFAKKKLSQGEIYQLSQVSDQIALFYFDTGIADQESYIKGMRKQLEMISLWKEALGSQVPDYLLVISTTSSSIRYRDVKIEEFSNALLSLRSIYLDTAPIIDGIGIYADWQTTEEQWELYRSFWLGQ